MFHRFSKTGGADNAACETRSLALREYADTFTTFLKCTGERIYVRQIL